MEYTCFFFFFQKYNDMICYEFKKRFFATQSTTAIWRKKIMKKMNRFWWPMINIINIHSKEKSPTKGQVVWLGKLSLKMIPCWSSSITSCNGYRTTRWADNVQLFERYCYKKKQFHIYRRFPKHLFSLK